MVDTELNRIIEAYEDGTISRRQLVLTLSGLAAATRSASAAPSSASVPSPEWPMLDKFHAAAARAVGAQVAAGTGGGREPLPRPDGALLNTVVQSTRQAPALTVTNDTALQPFPEEFLSIDAAVATDSDFDVSSIARAAEQFKFWQVEVLADQAADLLDRCADDRAAYDDLRAKWAKLILEVIEFEQLDAVHRDEISAGWYTLNHDQSGPDLEALTFFTRPAIGTPNGVGSLEDDRNEGYEAARTMAAAAYDELIKASMQSRLHEEATRTQRAATIDRGRMIEETGYKIEQALFAAQGHSTEKQIASRQAKERWDRVDIEFRRRRSTIAIAINELRKKQMLDPGCSYNYPEQMKPIRSRFMRDFRDGYARLLRVRDGLRQIYGVTLPGFPQISVSTPSNAGMFDQALRWSREAIRTLIALGHSDQSYTLSLSIRTAIGAGAWNAAAARATQPNTPFTCSFEVPPARMRDQQLVRLRGISMFVVTQRVPTGVWHAIVRPPVGALGGQPPAPLDQTQVPPVHLGRVGRRDSEQPPDVAGAVVLRNVSIVGDPTKPEAQRKWLLTVYSESTASESFSEIRDIQIDLHLMVQVPTT